MTSHVPVRFAQLLMAAILFSAGATALAQTSPLPPTADPVRINEEQRRRLQERLDEAPGPTGRATVEVPPPAPRSDGAAGPSFRLNALRVGESAYLTRAELDAITQPLVGRDVTIADLRGAVDAINALYEARGAATARAALPAQDVQGGVVDIQLIEGRIGMVQAQGGRASDQRRATRLAGIPERALADPRQIERRLRRFNRDNDVQLRAQLVPGQAFGTTDLVLIVTPPRRVAGELFADNNGFASTGTFQAGAVVRGYGLFGPDRLALVAVRSDGVESGSLTYSLPLGGDRVRAGLSLSRGETRVRNGPGSELGIRGSSTSYGVDLAAAVIADEALLVNLTGSVQQVESDTRIANTLVVDSRTLQAAAGVDASFAAPGFFASGDLGLVFAGSRERLSGTNSEPLVLRGSLNLAQALAGGWQLRVRGDFQQSASATLPGVLQYQVGGARSVRAYAPGIAAGSGGFSAAADLVWSGPVLGRAVEASVFLDRAAVRTGGSTIELADAGAGLALPLHRNVTARLHYAHALSRAFGRPDRFFVAASLRF